MVTVVVPWRGGCPHREKAWALVQQQYALKHPDWRVVEAVAPEGPWSKGTATAPAIEDAPDGIIVLADADVWCDGLAEAVDVVRSGLAAWAVPHLMVRRLTADATNLLMAPGTRMGDGSAVLSGSAHAGTGQAQHLQAEQRPYRGVQGGGIVVTTREVIRQTPLDPRFVGWG